MMAAPRRAILGAFVAAPVVAVAGAASAAPANEGVDATGFGYWQRFHRVLSAIEARYEAACARQDAAEDALLADPGSASARHEVDRANAEGSHWGNRCRKMGIKAPYIPARDWPSLSLKLECIGFGPALDELADDRLWRLLEAEIRHAIALRG